MISARYGWLLGALLLGACSSGMEDLELKVAEVKSRKSTAIEPIPQMKQYEAFVFEPAGRRDPFTAVEPERDGKGFNNSGITPPDVNRNKEPLEEFPLDALRMVGTVTTGGRQYAMVKAPDGVIHRIQVKDHMGQNYGQITAISEAEVTLSEIIPDGFGGWMQRPATLALVQ